MSVVDINKIDGIGISRNEEKLVLLLTDHLDWSSEYDHLIQLQAKLNSYIAFLESQQYNEIYPNRKFLSFNIEIHFLYELTPSCIKFIEVVNKNLVELNCSIEIIVDKSASS